MPQPPKILLTNDDGIHSAGLRALEEALVGLGEILVVAPDSERSGASHGLTLHAPLRIHRFDDSHFAVSGTPADAVILALHHILSAPAAICVSGINPGGNLGENVMYSGTVAAAMEATLHGVPGIAMSLATRGNQDFSWAAATARQTVERVLRDGLPPGVMLNVNVPRGQPIGTRLTRQSQKISQNIVLEKKDPRGRPYYWQDESVALDQVEPDSDYAAVLAQYVSITPLQADRTDYPSFKQISAWLQP